MSRRRDANRAETIVKAVGAVVLLVVLLLVSQVMPGMLKGKNPQEMMDAMVKLIGGFVFLATLGSIAGLVAWRMVRSKGRQTAEPDSPPQPNSSATATPACPKCGQLMVLRKGDWGEFWGCSGFPKCRGKREPGKS